MDFHGWIFQLCLDFGRRFHVFFVRSNYHGNCVKHHEGVVSLHHFRDVIFRKDLFGDGI